MDLNWLTPMAEAHPVGPKGWGSFARECIVAGTTVAGFGGYVTTVAMVHRLTPDRVSRSIQVDDDLYLVSAETPEPGDMLNRSCDPNCGLMGGTLLVAMRDLEPGDELSFDYATCDSSDYDEFDCACSALVCRGTVTGRDWMLPELQAKYAGWFSPYLARRIAAGQVDHPQAGSPG